MRWWGARCGAPSARAQCPDRDRAAGAGHAGGQVRELSCRCGAARFWAWRGLDGSGARRFARLLAGVDLPDAGRITLAGADHPGTLRGAMRAGVGYVPDDRKMLGPVPGPVDCGQRGGDQPAGRHAWRPRARGTGAGGGRGADRRAGREGGRAGRDGAVAVRRQPAEGSPGKMAAPGAAPSCGGRARRASTSAPARHSCPALGAGACRGGGS